MFRLVGDVADSVSNLKLVEALPNALARLDVFSDSFGLFEGDGPGGSKVGTVCWLQDMREDGSSATDIVPVPIE